MRPDRAMDLLTLSVAGVQTGFGAFVAAHLAANQWTPGQIGVVLTVQTVASLVFQLPCGMLVDRLTAGRLLLALAILVLAAGALLIASFPGHAVVTAALVLQGLGGAVLVPAILAQSLRIAGGDGLGERLGRNGRYGAVGSGGGAALMGAAASLVSDQAVFLLTALLALPGLWALAAMSDVPEGTRGVRRVRATLGRIREDASRTLRHGPKRRHEPPTPLPALLRDRRLWVFGLCVVLFHMASAAVLVLAVAALATGAGQAGGFYVAAFVIVPQVLVALLSPAVGRAAQASGRRPMLLLGYATLPARAAAFALVSSPPAQLPIQLLEGVAGASFGVLLPLVAADVTRGTGRTNLVLGAFGLCAALGAALSTLVAGWVAGRWGAPAAFWLLAGIGAAALVLVALALPETRAAKVAEPV